MEFSIPVENATAKLMVARGIKIGLMGIQKTRENVLGVHPRPIKSAIRMHMVIGESVS